VPALDHELVDDADIASLKSTLLESGLSPQRLVSTAWASAASFRKTDLRGGANGARLRLAPQKDWEVNEPQELATALSTLERVQQEFNDAQSGGKRISLADLIVLGGVAAVEQAAREGGVEVTVPFRPGRTDATAEQTDADSFRFLEPRADAFRGYLRSGEKIPAEALMVDRAYMLDLTAPELTVLLGGMRSLGATVGGSRHGVLTDRPGVLSTDFFVNLLTPGQQVRASRDDENVYEIQDTVTGETRWTATGADLAFGSNSELRALAEVYASDDAREKFVHDFVAAWDKVMEADRFDRG
jgi:catalase-peroxidase